MRDLKTHLSRHLKRVRSGTSLLVGDRGRPIATISPVDVPPGTEWASEMVAAGHAHWSGGKPAGARTSAPLRRGHTVSAAVIEDRR